jgi:adenine-specific DNA methylase
VYDVFARFFKRFRVVITIDSRFSARKKSRVDAQNRVSSKIAFDLNLVETKKKKKKKREEEKEKKKKKKKTTMLMMMTMKITLSMFESCRSLSANSFKFRFLSSSTRSRLFVVLSRSR